jgi:membrane protease YdiL (CAAX protease family)
MTSTRRSPLPATPALGTRDAALLSIVAGLVVMLPLLALAAVDVDLLEALLVKPRPLHVGVVHGIIPAAAAVALLILARRRAVTRALSLQPCSRRALLAGVAVGIVIAGWPTLLLLALDASLLQRSLTSTQVAATFLPTVLTVPLLEELLFRGVLLSWLATRVPFPAAALLSSVAFGAIHGAGILWATLAGLAICELIRRTGSLWPGVALHIAHNFAMLLLAAGPGRP